jgi:glycerol-3-phosphate acyltransferase PlsY
MRSTLRRRLFHLSAGLCIVLAAWFLPRTALLASLGLATALFLTFEFIRLRAPTINRWFFSRFGSLLRKEEAVRVTTSSYFLVAAMVAYLAFGKEIAVVSVSFLAVGDVAAGVVGQHMGRTRVFHKAMEGHLACFACCLATGLLLRSAGLDIGQAAMLAGSFGATVGQAIPNPVDDNLTLPLLAGAAMAIVPP